MYIVLFGLFVSFCLFLYAAKYLIEYNKSGYCYRQNSKLTGDEMRAQVVKNLLSTKLHEQSRYNGLYELFVLDRVLSKQDVINSISDTSIINFTRKQRLTIKTANDIDDVMHHLQGVNFSIVTYSQRARSMEIIPGSSIVTASEHEARQYFDANTLGIAEIEKIGGFGNYLYRIEVYGEIGMACCDGLGEKNGLSPLWYADNSIKTIHGKETNEYASRLIVSNCGELLLREHHGEQIYIFY